MFAPREKRGNTRGIRINEPDMNAPITSLPNINEASLVNKDKGKAVMVDSVNGKDGTEPNHPILEGVPIDVAAVPLI